MTCQQFKTSIRTVDPLEVSFEFRSLMRQHLASCENCQQLAMTLTEGFDKLSGQEKQELDRVADDDWERENSLRN